MRRITLFAILVWVLSLLLAACGGGDDGAGGVEPNAARGEELYKEMMIGAADAPGCIGCHSLEEGIMLVGPSHAGIATRAETAVPGQSAQAYLKESIIDPDATITENFTAGLMYPNYGADLTDQEIADLVAFLLTLK